MFNAQAVYKNSDGFDLQLHLDIDLKSEKILDFIIKGSLKEIYEKEFLELKSLIVDHTIAESLILKREALKNETKLKNGSLPLASLSLWLMHQAIEDYLGTTSTLSEQNDLLCLCYGIGVKEIKKQILTRSDYDLPQLVAETFATSACGSCRIPIQKVMTQIRQEHGLIKGMDHSQTRLDKAGHWIKIKDLYPADLLIKLDELKKIWMKREGIEDQFKIEIEKIEGHHLWLRVSPENDPERSLKVLAALSDYWRSEIGALFFLHLVDFVVDSL